jgi:hypothetical protein
MPKQRFDIFSGSPDNQPLWLEVTDGLTEATARMEQRASTESGRYFVYDSWSQTVVASIDTEINKKTSGQNESR